MFEMLVSINERPKPFEYYTKYTIIEPTRTWTVYNWLQYFTPDSIKLEFEENGLKIEEYYSGVAGKEFRQESLEFAIVARKIRYEESISLTG